MVLQGLLAGRFLHFPAVVPLPNPVEQSYGGVEGDSASIAKLVAILPGYPACRSAKSVAVTGSLNQNSRAQAVDGVHHKIEGFQACVESGGPTGRQGVVIPRVNCRRRRSPRPGGRSRCGKKILNRAVNTIQKTPWIA